MPKVLPLSSINLPLRPPSIPWIIYVLGLTVFALGTSEFMVAGMMPSLTLAFDVSVTQIGYLISYYALGIVVGGPLLSIILLKLRYSNKRALLIMLCSYAVLQAIATITSHYGVMALVRIATGMVAAACFGLSLSICVPLVHASLQARAFAIVIGGLMISMVIGVPLATIIDQYFGWRTSFGSVVFITILGALLLGRFLPDITSTEIVNLRSEWMALKQPSLWAAYATSALIIGATFAGYGYFVPILGDLSKFSPTTIPWILGGFGIACVIGNILVGRYADRHALNVMLLGLTLLAIALAVFALFAEYQSVSILMVLLVGLAGIPMNPAMIYRVMTVVSLGPLVSTTHTSIINIGLALGTWMGGIALNGGLGLRAPLWIGCFLALIGILSLLPYAIKQPRGFNHTTAQ